LIQVKVLGAGRGGSDGKGRSHVPRVADHYPTAESHVVGAPGGAGSSPYAMLVKQYGTPPQGTPERRYSRAECIGAVKNIVSGQPDEKHISTSYAERSNLTLRMGCRCFTRLTNAFSKKVANHEDAVALHMMHYNFARIHKTLRVTPAMAADVY
jgi:hypothetical protein